MNSYYTNQQALEGIFSTYSRADFSNGLQRTSSVAASMELRAEARGCKLAFKVGQYKTTKDPIIVNCTNAALAIWATDFNMWHAQFFHWLEAVTGYDYINKKTVSYGSQASFGLQSALNIDPYVETLISYERRLILLRAALEKIDKTFTTTVSTVPLPSVPPPPVKQKSLATYLGDTAKQIQFLTWLAGGAVILYFFGPTLKKGTEALIGGFAQKKRTAKGK